MRALFLSRFEFPISGCRGLLHPMANSYWLPIQVGHLAFMFLRQPAAMRHMERGLHHLNPLTGVVNAAAAKFGMATATERDVLFWMWMVLEVCRLPSLTFVTEH